MHVFLMIIVFLGADGGHVVGQAYPTVAACEAAKTDVTRDALRAGITDLGLTCVDVSVAKVS